MAISASSTPRMRALRYKISDVRDHSPRVAPPNRNPRRSPNPEQIGRRRNSQAKTLPHAADRRIEQQENPHSPAIRSQGPRLGDLEFVGHVRGFSSQPPRSETKQATSRTQVGKRRTYVEEGAGRRGLPPVSGGGGAHEEGGFCAAPRFCVA
jgi:hypothetical protein